MSSKRNEADGAEAFPSRRASATPPATEGAAGAGPVHPLLARNPRTKARPFDTSTQSAASKTPTASGSRPRRHNRTAMVVFVALGALTCLALGYWQLSRWNSAQGSFQNLGYALEWPFFAAFLVFAYRRWVRLADGEAQLEHEVVQTEIPANFLPPRRSDALAPPENSLDPALREYNQYLADLNASGTQGQDDAATGTGTNALTEPTDETNPTAHNQRKDP